MSEVTLSGADRRTEEKHWCRHSTDADISESHLGAFRMRRVCSTVLDFSTNAEIDLPLEFALDPAKMSSKYLAW